MMVGKSKKQSFDHYLDWFNKIVHGWSMRFLSMGGKEIFIKIPGLRDWKIQCQNIDIHFTSVSQLINSETCTWIEERVRAILNDSQTERVFAIPLAITERLDTLIWRCNGLGEYSPNRRYKYIGELRSSYSCKLWVSFTSATILDRGSSVGGRARDNDGLAEMNFMGLFGLIQTATDFGLWSFQYLPL
ncbi:hypothetical protein PVK06_023199 [Gossypium arboreum]|uniref:Uncharacterized protein n=1 Tax=Gossypium arboreum TaxID=29729 RepID=A0ABR0PAH2_GOSAR|nr:hypothetical protein PVK06_023199 [Gossypium arboreum]